MHALLWELLAVQLGGKLAHSNAASRIWDSILAIKRISATNPYGRVTQHVY